MVGMSGVVVVRLFSGPWGIGNKVRRSPVCHMTRVDAGGRGWGLNIGDLF